MNTPISVQQAGFQAGKRVLLDSVSLAAASGEVLGIVGPNGAGKSTLLRMIAGDLTPSTGRVLIGDQDVSSISYRGLSQLRAYLGPKDVRDIPFTARDVVAMGRHPHRRSQLDPKEHDSIVDSALERTDLTMLRDRVISSLSTGERQRVGLARVLAQDTPVLLLDEPTSALDIGHQESVMRLLRSSAAEGKTVLAVLHDLNLASAYADRLILLNGGGVRAAGSPHSVLVDDTLTETYKLPMRVVSHPDRDCPLVLTLDDD